MLEIGVSIKCVIHEKYLWYILRMEVLNFTKKELYGRYF